MNPGNNGKDDEDETHASYYRDLFADAEYSEHDKPPRWFGGLITLVCALGVWVGIWLTFRSCMGE